MPKRITIPDIIGSKGKRKLSMLTAYDYPTAHILNKAGIDMILVGDSLAMVILGLEDTLAVSMDDMLYHTRAVSRAASHSLVIGDMPFMSYQVSTEQAIINAGRFLKEAGAHAVKLEGGHEVLEQIRGISQAGIPVQGHLGLTPQKAGQFGGFKVQGKTSESAQIIIEEAQALQEAGCFSIVLEAVPAEISARVSENIHIPCIGIGAGPDCDGQVLVIHDLVGLFERFTPKFVKRYAELGREMEQAVRQYKQEVESGVFPGAEHSFSIKQEELDKLGK